MPHTPGSNYTREAIRLEHDGDPTPPLFVVHKGNQVRALRLRFAFNPKIRDEPAQVWVGTGPEREPWGDKLALDTGAVHLYVGDTDSEDAYAYLGIYHVIGHTQDPQELHLAKQHPGIGSLSRIVFLKRH